MKSSRDIIPISMLTRRNLLILFFLLLAAVQIVRVDFFVNHALFDWTFYAHGHALMPYQGRVAMAPVLLWAEHVRGLQLAASRYQGMLSAGSPLIEGYNADKLISLLVGILALWVTVGAAAWYGMYRMARLWWMPPALTLLIAAVMLDLRLEHNLWYPYDLPHVALFSLSLVCALQRRWVLSLVFFALDLPMRETSLFLLPIILPLFWLDDDVERARLVDSRSWSGVLGTARAKTTALLGGVMLVVWELVHLAINHRFAANPDETGPRLSRNLHQLLLPHHWPQLFSAGGYLAVFVWLGRRRLPVAERLMLWGSALCAPVVLYFSVWNETRVWLEWTVPIAIAASLEMRSYFAEAQAA